MKTADPLENIHIMQTQCTIYYNYFNTDMKILKSKTFLNIAHVLKISFIHIILYLYFRNISLYL